MEARTCPARPVPNKAAVEDALSKIPNARTSAIRQVMHFGRDQYGFLESMQAELGDVFQFRIPREPVRIVVGHPEEIRKVFALRGEQIYSGDPGMHVNYGESCILFNDGDQHTADRKLMTPALRGNLLNSYGDHILATTVSVVETWQHDQDITLLDELARITLSIITRCILGAEDRDGEEELQELVNGWLEAVLSPGMFTLAGFIGLNRTRRFLEQRTNTLLHEGKDSPVPYPGRRSIRLKAKFMRRLLEDIDACRRAGESSRTDVLSRITNARYDDGELMPTQTVVDQLTLLFSAGHETTAKSMAWAMLDILRRPEVLANIRNEIETVTGGALTPNNCQKLEYLQSVINESMRLTPVTTVVQRDVTETIRLSSYQILPGMTVAPSNYLAHRHPDYWPDPTVFNPERFMNRKRKPEPWVFFPFGGGRRKCLGDAFAMYEMSIILAVICQRADLLLVPGADHTPIFKGVTVGPKGGLPVRLA